MLQMNIFGTKSRNMNGHRVFLIIIGLYVIGIEAPRNKNAHVMPIMTDIIEDLDVTPIVLHQIDYNILGGDMVTNFFLRESQWFSKVECLYGIDVEGSTSTSIKIKPLVKEEDIYALAYITYLTFWIAVDFRFGQIIFVNFEDDNKEEYEPLKTMCYSYFKEMNFAFREFREQLTKFTKKVEGKRLSELSAEEWQIHMFIKTVTTLSLDVVSDEETLREHPPDEYSVGILKWTYNIPFILSSLPHEYYKTLFPDIREVHFQPGGSRTIQDVQAKLYRRIEGEINTNRHEYVWERLVKELLRISDHDFQLVSPYLLRTSDRKNFNNNLQMWKYVLEKNLVVNSQNEMQRIKKVLEIIRTIRHVNYTVLVKTMRAPHVPPPQPEQ